MKYLDEYRDPEVARGLVRQIRARATRRWVLMEVCGGQTHTIVKQGLDELLATAVEMIHGPGCPGLRHAAGADRQGARARRAARRDLHLVRRHAAGARQRVRPAAGPRAGRRRAGGLLAARRARARASSTPTSEVVFFAVGFETTAPANAMAVWRARELGVEQLQRAGVARDGAAGDERHPRRAGQPGAGLPRRRPRLHRDGMDRVRADRRAVPGADRRHRLRAGGHPRGDRARGAPARGGPARGGEPVRAGGARARAPSRRADLVEQVFELADRKWRGIGEIPRSGLRAARRSSPTSTPSAASALGDIAVEEPAECRAGDVLRGQLKPHQCPAFGTRCTPEQPLGAPMVSSEGACAAYYNYGRLPRGRAAPVAST